MTPATLQGLADCLRHVAPLAEQDEEESARLEHYVNVVQQWVHDLSDSNCLERFVHSGGGYEATHFLKVVMLADLTANGCRLREVVAETLQILASIPDTRFGFPAAGTPGAAVSINYQQAPVGS